MMTSFLLLVLIFIFWHINFSLRIWSGFIFGFFMDSLSIFPFGTYISALVLSSILTAFFQEIFSDIDSLFAKGVAVSALFFIINSFIYPLSFVIGKARAGTIFWSPAAEVDIIIWSLIPSVILVLLFGFMHFRKLRSR